MSDEPVAVDAAAVWPDDAEDVDEGVVANWFVRPGARVAEGDPLCEIQVEKVSVDVPAPVAGEVTERLIGTNETFTRGDTLARISPE